MLAFRVSLGALAVGVVCLAATPHPAWATESPKLAAAVDDAFRPLLAQYDVPGIALAVTIGGEHAFFNYGFADKDGNKPVTEHTLFEIGSLSKTFTATLIGCAQATGQVSLDDHPDRFMPGLQGSAVDRASLLNLATFTAGGLPLQFPDPVRTDADMVAYFQHWRATAAPGEIRQYSNPSIGLAGHLVGLAMHREFRDLIEGEIFPRLGLAHSHIRVPAAEMGDYAWGTGAAGKPIRVSPGVLDAEAYGVKSSAEDMIRFVDANLRPEALAPQISQALAATHVGYFGTSTAMVQGLGWEQYPYPVTLDRLLAGNATAMIMEPNAVTRLAPPRAPSEPTLFNKTGSTNGFGAYAVFVPAKRIGLVMLANRNFPIPARIKAAYSVLEALAAAAP